MADARRQHHHIACLKRQGLSLVAAELHTGLAAGDAKHFMGAGMEMQELVDPVAPGILPAVCGEQLLAKRRRVESAAAAQHVAIVHQRQAWIVGCLAVVLEAVEPWRATVDQLREVIGRRTTDAGDRLGYFLDLLGERHGSSCLTQNAQRSRAVPVGTPTSASRSSRYNMKVVLLTATGSSTSRVNAMSRVRRSLNSFRGRRGDRTPGSSGCARIICINQPEVARGI